MSSKHRLGDLQLAIIRVLWEAGEATVAAVHQTLLPARGLALTTIATMLKKMKQKGVVTHRSEGRQFIYSATIEEEDVHRSMVGDLVDRLFGGRPSELVSHLLQEGEIDPGDLDEITAMLRRRRKSKERGRG